MTIKSNNVLAEWEKYKDATPVEFSLSLHCCESLYVTPEGTILFRFELDNDTPVDYVKTYNE